MRLPNHPRILARFNHTELLEAILERRKVIREHRDQVGDDRCWLDDYLVWDMLDDSMSRPLALPTFTDGMNKCEIFYIFRRAENKDPTPKSAILNPTLWDKDLDHLTPSQLWYELSRLQNAISKHRDIFDRNRSIDDDRELYNVLPEKIPADFRLPPKEEFLGEAKAPTAGCPSFWRSHGQCTTRDHNFHCWGPCK